MSPRCLGPSRSTSEGRGAAHGPRHPAYPLLPRSLILLWGFGSHSFCFVGSVCVFCSEAEILCALLSALQDPTPCSNHFWVPLSSFVVWLFFCSPSSRFSSSALSGAGETQTASRFVVPLVFSRPRSFSSTRSPSTAPTSRRTSRLCCFWLGFVVGVSLSLSLSLSLGRPGGLVLCMQKVEKTLGWPIRRRPPL